MEQHICDHEGCGKVFKQKRYLKDHKKYIHLCEKTFECNDCKSMFKKRYDLKIHQLRIHSDERPIECDQCDATFKRKNDLDAHQLRIHSDKRPIECNQCDATFKMKKDLDVHKQRKHSDERPFQCDQCDATFKTKYDQLDHQLRHSDERPFECDQCNAAFKIKVDLTVHKQRVHSDERPFECTICNKTFKLKKDVGIHMLLHNPDKDFKCPDENCPYESCCESYIKRHFKNIHTEKGMLRQKKQEEKIAKLLTKHGIPFAREHSISFSCISDANKYARIDFVIELNGGIIFLEVDEHQHRFGYDSVNCDLKRMSYVMESLVYGGNTLPILWLRYNPNVYRVNGIKQLIRQYEREEILVDFMRNWSPGSDMEIKYFFYNLVDGELEIHRNQEYDDYFKTLCI